MCGIIGFVSKKVTHIEKDFLTALVIESKIRGLHSFGFSYFDGSLKTEKFFKIPVKEVARAAESGLLIYHNRYSTSGDWQNVNNNQPIQINERYSIAMNGVISMKTKEEFEEEFGVKCDTYNDTEIFLRKLEQGVEPGELVRTLSGAFAVLWFGNGKIYAARNSFRPLHFFFLGNALYFVSTVDIVRRALKRAGVTEKVYVHNAQPFKVYDLLQMVNEYA